MERLPDFWYALLVGTKNVGYQALFPKFSQYTLLAGYLGNYLLRLATIHRRSYTEFDVEAVQCGRIFGV